MPNPSREPTQTFSWPFRPFTFSPFQLWPAEIVPRRRAALVTTPALAALGRAAERAERPSGTADPRLGACLGLLRAVAGLTLIVLSVS